MSTSAPHLDAPAAAEHASAAERSTLIWAAWIGTLLMSKLPLVIARDLLGSDIPWIVPGWWGMAALLIAATYLWPAIRPLRRYFVVMGVLLVMGFGVRSAVSGTAAWSGLFAGLSGMASVFSDRLLLMLETLVVLVTLFLLGVKRREAFLTVGDLRAPVGSRPSTRRWTLRWSLLGPVAAIVLGGLFFLFMFSLNPAALTNPGVVIPWLPLILFSAALNAFGEEFNYRAAPISVLLPAVGPGHALWMTSLWFGLGHYYGGAPSGPVGLVQTGLLALLMGKAMLDTRGLGWPWIIHVVMDIVIYFFIAATVMGTP